MSYNLNEFEKALSYFENRVSVICSMEMGGKIDAQTAYKKIKEELKSLKKTKKEFYGQSESCPTEKNTGIGSSYISYPLFLLIGSLITTCYTLLN